MGLLTNALSGGGAGVIGKAVSMFKNRGKKSGGKADMSNAYSGSMNYDDYHKGGKVRKTGLARVHKGERVLTKGQQRKAGMARGRGKKR
jgi:hypothetical protein